MKHKTAYVVWNIVECNQHIFKTLKWDQLNSVFNLRLSITFHKLLNCLSKRYFLYQGINLLRLCCFSVYLSPINFIWTVLCFLQKQIAGSFQLDFYVCPCYWNNSSTCNLFQSQKASPPLLRNYPPVAGSIFWERFLFHRIKRPILAFQKVDAITALSFKNTVSIIHYRIFVYEGVRKDLWCHWRWAS